MKGREGGNRSFQPMSRECGGRMGQDAQEAGGQMRSAKEGDFICKVMGTCEGFKQDSDGSRVLA